MHAAPQRVQKVYKLEYCASANVTTPDSQRSGSVMDTGSLQLRHQTQNTSSQQAARLVSLRIAQGLERTRYDMMQTS